MKSSINIPSKKESWKMFDRIASTYDRINHLLSFGLDRYWRRQLLRLVKKKGGISLLDGATGTCDQLIALMESDLVIDSAVGLDPSINMLAQGKIKIEKKSYRKKIDLVQGTLEQTPFDSNSFDIISISFGVRNVMNVLDCLEEMYRILKPSGQLLILEFSLPESRVLKCLYLVYLRYILPFIGKLCSKDPSAYVYLNKTIEGFPYGNHFCKILKQAGFQKTCYHSLTMGTVNIYEGFKPTDN
ncbi:MAG: bifunctional demethylmenaquinone methyltransferase/2-methoxy-6-polyprenyl-1,4-benzoquinol methylase UbiE [Rhabdochlamydiaceae bacterium]